VVLLRPRNDFYVAKIPQPEDILLLVEVADRTTKYDREIKIPLYAENNIFEVWLIDVNNKTLEIYRNPSLNGYEQIEQITSNKLFSTLSFPNVTINFDEIFSVLSM
jgi:Uma2 family endonuclease